MTNQEDTMSEIFTHKTIVFQYKWRKKYRVDRKNKQIHNYILGLKPSPFSNW